MAVNATFAAKYAVDGGQLPAFKMLDLRGQTPRRNVASNFATFTGFTTPNDISQWARIDFVYGGNNLGWCVSFYYSTSQLLTRTPGRQIDTLLEPPFLTMECWQVIIVQCFLIFQFECHIQIMRTCLSQRVRTRTTSSLLMYI